LTIIATWVAAQPKPECQSNCGDISIHYREQAMGATSAATFSFDAVHMASLIHFQTSPYLIPETSSQPLVEIPMLSLRVPWDIRIQPDGAYNFSVSDLSNVNFNTTKFPIILDWTIGNQNCTEAKLDPKNYACKENSVCIDPENYNCKENTSCINPGYLCKCLDGFQGNPYLSYGCQDIDECQTLKPCNETATCDNVAGSYYCSCPEGFEGDGQKNGAGCSPKVKSHESFPTLLVAL
ncbi:hypothetical protein Gohar_024182, partial [Gossypium harknessii]|nr:hypothetical protein [Gossypium harknessii]